MKRLTISMDTLREVVYHGYAVVTREYFSAYFKARSGKDLPGIWPKFFLYADLTWSIGYEPKKIPIADVPVKEYKQPNELLDDILLYLDGNHDVFTPPPPEGPKHDDKKGKRGKAKREEEVPGDHGLPGATVGEDEALLARVGHEHGHGSTEGLPGHTEAAGGQGPPDSQRQDHDHRVGSA